MVVKKGKTMIIELPAEMETRLRAAASESGMDLNQYATALIYKGLEDAPVLAWDDGQPMTEEEKAAIRAKVERGIADGEAGRVLSSKETYARLYAKLGISTEIHTK